MTPEAARTDGREWLQRLSAQLEREAATRVVRRRRRRAAAAAVILAAAAAGAAWWGRPHPPERATGELAGPAAPARAPAPAPAPASAPARVHVAWGSTDVPQRVSVQVLGDAELVAALAREGRHCAVVRLPGEVRLLCDGGGPGGSRGGDGGG